jgi:hypothetical protein
VDKNVITNIPIDPTKTFNNTFRPLIEQNGVFYLAGILGPTNHGGNTGYQTISQTGLLATDFTDADFTAGTSGNSHPDFAGGPMLFGLGQIAGFGVFGLTNVNFEADYDNLQLSVHSTPDSGDTALLLCVSISALAFAGCSRRTMISRSMRRLS